MFRDSALPAWVFLLAAALILSLGRTPGAAAQDEVDKRLAAGEIIVSTKEIPGTSVRQGEILGIIEASPRIVWRVITDVNSYKSFMPRTLNSLAVAAEKLPLIFQSKPTRAREVEQLLGTVPADPAGARIPGGTYIVYLYSHLEFPWPCSDRWYIIRLQQDESRADRHFYHSSWSLVIGNLRKNTGEWLLEPFGAERTKVTYRLLADPGGAIPKFLVNKGTCVSMPEIITAIRKRAAQLGKPRQP